MAPGAAEVAFPEDSAGEILGSKVEQAEGIPWERILFCHRASLFQIILFIPFHKKESSVIAEFGRVQKRP